MTKNEFIKKYENIKIVLNDIIVDDLNKINEKEIKDMVDAYYFAWNDVFEAEYQIEQMLEEWGLKIK